TIAYGALIPTGTVAITLNGVTQNAAIGTGGNFSSSFATAALPSMNPPYTIGYSYPGDANFNPNAGAGTLTIGFAITALYDQAQVNTGGSTVPVTFELTDASGRNLSSASIVVTAISLVPVGTNATAAVEDAGNANSDSKFRFDSSLAPGGGYILNLKTTN